MDSHLAPDLIARFTALAESLADLARPVAKRLFRTGLAVDGKDDESPVTAADREIETLVRDRITESFPDHGILGEEHGGERLDAEYLWVIDPIDGTKSFITGKPTFGTLIALCRHGRPLVGVIDMPALGERWVGATGQPTTHDGKPVMTRTCPGLDSAYFYTTAPEMFSDADATLGPFERLRTAVRYPLYGADCFAYGLLASGWVDVVCEAQLKPYDYAALVPVVEGAGGTFTDWHGAPVTIGCDGRVLAAGDPRVHAAALEVLRG